MLRVEASTDSQLLYIRGLCDDRGLIRPEAVASKSEASEIIDAILAGTYDPGRYAYPFSMSDETVPF